MNFCSYRKIIVGNASNECLKWAASFCFKARKDISPFNHWRRKVEPPHDAYVHRDRTGTIDLVAAANQFVSKQEIGDIYPKWFARKLCLVSHPNETKQEN